MTMVHQIRLPAIACSVAFCILGPSLTMGDAITVEDWDLSVGVERNWPDYAGASFLTPINPFVNQHAVSLPSNPATTAAAQYDLSWLVSYPYGSFNIASQLAVQDGDFIQSTASGVIDLHSETDLSLNLSGTFDYDLPGIGQWVTTFFRVTDRDTQGLLLSDYHSYDTDTAPPGQGTLTLSGNVLLPAGHNYRLQHWMRIETAGSSSTLAGGSGSISVLLTPEPASFAFLVAGLVVSGRRRMRRSQRTLAA